MLKYFLLICFIMVVAPPHNYDKPVIEIIFAKSRMGVIILALNSVCSTIYSFRYGARHLDDELVRIGLLFLQLSAFVAAWQNGLDFQQ